MRAPGRVNLIGEHTDYCQGLVLPCAIDRALWLAVAARSDHRVRIFAADFGSAGEVAEFVLDDGDSITGFGGYVKAVVAAFCERGIRPMGMDLAIASDVPIGSGLSSSAALVVATALAIDQLLQCGAGAEALARIAHRAESHFVGTGCGVLDPFAVSLAREGYALRIDCRSQAVTRVPLPIDELTLLISHSGVTRELASHDHAVDPGAGYRARVAQCDQALAGAKRVASGLEAASALRDVPLSCIVELESKMDALLFRRLRHVVSENARVDRVCAALQAPEGADLVAMGLAVREAHASLRDDFEVSISELDLLCETADGLAGVYGSRLVGAGFGGCALHLVRPEAAEVVSQALSARFRRHYQRTPEILSVRSGPGASISAL